MTRARRNAPIPRHHLPTHTETRKSQITSSAFGAALPRARAQTPENITSLRKNNQSCEKCGLAEMNERLIAFSDSLLAAHRKFLGTGASSPDASQYAATSRRVGIREKPRIQLRL